MVVEILFERFVVVVGVSGSMEKFDGDGSWNSEIEIPVASIEFDVEDSVFIEGVVIPADLVSHSTGESLFVVFGEVDGLSGNCFHCSI